MKSVTYRPTLSKLRGGPVKKITLYKLPGKSSLHVLSVLSVLDHDDHLVPDDYHNYRVVFLTGPPLKMSLDWPPSKMLRLAPPTLKKVLSIAAERGEIRNTHT